MEETEKCCICGKNKAKWAIQHHPDDVCTKCWCVYMHNLNVPDWVSEEQVYRYRRIKVRKILGYQAKA